MVDRGLDACCCEKNIESIDKIEKNSLCPVCNRSGITVGSFTVKHLVLDTLKETVGDNKYYLCMKEECNIVYYNYKMSFNQNQVKVPIWFKKDANPKYACYCSRITEEQVIYTVIKDGAKTIKDIIDITGVMKNAQCQKNNPLGKCCHKIIQEAIDKGISMK